VNGPDECSEDDRQEYLEDSRRNADEEYDQDEMDDWNERGQELIEYAERGY